MAVSLKSKLIVMLVMITVPTVITFVWLGRKAINGIEQSKIELIKSSSKSIADKLDRVLFERYGDVQAFALSEPARSGDHGRIQRFMNDMMTAYAPVYDLMMVVNKDGKVIAVNTVSKTGSQLDTSFLIGHDYSAQSWFKESVSGRVKIGSSHVEDVHIDSVVSSITGGDGAVMNFTAPIFDPSGKEILGVWTNRASWKGVPEEIISSESKAIIGERITNAFLYIIAPDGTYLTHPEGRKYQFNEKLPGFDENAHNAEVKTTSLKFGAFHADVFEAMAQSKGFATYPGLNWKIVLQVPKEDAIVDQFIALLALMLIIMTGTGVSSYWFVRRLASTLIRINSGLNREAEKLKESSQSIGNSSHSLAQASTEQAAALQETAAAIEQLSAMVKKNAENSVRSMEVAKEGSVAAMKGKESVERVIAAMDEISSSNKEIMSQINESNQQISEIIKVITEIGNKTKVINEIVFQTKLLSFNASVEAARAGEHGKGFAVVAEEVGNLAQMSGNASKEISEMLEGSIRKVEKIVNDTRSEVDGLIGRARVRTEAGTTLANECGLILTQVVTVVEDVSTMASEISTATREQSQGISEINKAMSQLDQVTHENAASAKSSATTSEHLSAQADALFSGIYRLRAIITGVKSDSTEVEPVRASRPGQHQILKPPRPTQVTNLNSIKHQSPVVASANLKKAVSGEFIPLENDPRFRDV